MSQPEHSTQVEYSSPPTEFDSIILSLWREVVHHETQGIIRRWKIGEAIVLEQQRGAPYGGHLVQHVATLLQLAPSTVYQYRAMAVQCPTQRELEQRISLLCATGTSLQWTVFRRAV